MFLMRRLDLSRSCASSLDNSLFDKSFLMLSNHLLFSLPLLLFPRHLHHHHRHYQLGVIPHYVALTGLTKCWTHPSTCLRMRSLQDNWWSWATEAAGKSSNGRSLKQGRQRLKQAGSPSEVNKSMKPSCNSPIVVVIYKLLILSIF